MNSVNIIGRLVQDPELRYTNSGTAVASARVAVDGAGEFISEQDGYAAGFFNVVVWGKQAENFTQYCYKGREVGITGRLQSRSYDSTKHDGERVYVVEINADRVQFLREPQGQSESAPAPEPEPAKPQRPANNRSQGGNSRSGNSGNRSGGSRR